MTAIAMLVVGMMPFLPLIVSLGIGAALFFIIKSFVKSKQALSRDNSTRINGNDDKDSR